MENVVRTIFDRVENSKMLRCIRSSFVMLIPVLLIGSFSLVLLSFPIEAYQNFITMFLSGIIYRCFSFVYRATFGFLAVYMTVAISLSFAQQYMPFQSFSYGPLLTSIACFCIFSGLLSEDFSIASLGGNGVFTAIVCALCASALYRMLYKKRWFFSFYADGADSEFNDVLQMLVPFMLVTTFFAVCNTIFVNAFHVSCFQELIKNVFNSIFSNMGRSLGTVELYVFLSSIFWFFGIHGSDVLETVCQHIFVPAIEENQQLLAMGESATEIFSKTFLNVFVLMGGCGTTICLFLAVLLFSKRRSNRKLMEAAAFPMFFNISEIVVYGLPVVFNPTLLIPFLVTPQIIILTSTAAMSLGLVPIPTVSVEWTTPVLFSGYLATGSVRGSLLQLFNVVIGVLIYRPFVRIFDEEKQRNARHQIEKLTQTFMQAEEEHVELDLLSLNSSLSVVSRTLAEDISYRIDRELPVLYYQPQYDEKGKCIGAESLLRWSHPLYGMVYPPLIISLAAANGSLMEFEKAVFCSVMRDMPKLLEVFGDDAEISINVTGNTIQTQEFEDFLKKQQKDCPEECRHICIEITEQNALLINDVQINRLSRIHEMGYRLAIDDFSMGSTSIKYLQNNIFDVIKLDGILSRNIMNNKRSLDIISSIVKLSDNFNISVLAEYVETEDQKKLLENVGCLLYQGYLYSPAKPLEKFTTEQEE